MFISNDYKSVIVYYPGTMKIYENDIIKVYGEVGNTLEGKNAYAASLIVPTIEAKYITKKGSASEYE